jgi:hypothetical protein
MDEMPKKNRSHLAGARIVEVRAKPKCFREFRGRPELIETCIESVRETAGVMVIGSDWRNAVDVVSNKCLKIKDLNQQTACITGTTEVLIRSADLPATLEGRRRR